MRNYLSAGMCFLCATLVGSMAGGCAFKKTGPESIEAKDEQVGIVKLREEFELREQRVADIFKAVLEKINEMDQRLESREKQLDAIAGLLRENVFACYGQKKGDNKSAHSDAGPEKGQLEPASSLPIGHYS
jgi:hypothetical protein